MDSEDGKMDKWIKCLAIGGNIHATAIIAPDLINEARKRHGLKQTGSKYMGEAILSGLLLSSTLRSGEHLSLSIKGDNYLRQAVIDATADGKVRGFLSMRNRPEDPEIEINPELGPWQTGLLTVVRMKKTEQEPYVGTVPLLTGFLAKDVTFYLSQSEQIPSAVGLAVNVEPDGLVRSAGAFLIQILPGATEKEIESVERNLVNMEQLAKQVSEHPNPTYLLSQVFNDFSFTIIEEKPLHFECHCTVEKVSNALRLLTKDELLDMIAKDKGADVDCDFCGKHFRFEIKDLADIVRHKP